METTEKRIRLKVNKKDNTINIKSIKNSYNREEVIEFAKKYGYYLEDKVGHSLVQKEDNKWIEENL